MRLFVIALMLIVTPKQLRGSERFTEVAWHTPNDWPGYIDEQGNGLYADLVNRVFKSGGITVKRETYPWKRSLKNVLVGKADFTGGLSPVNSYYLSKQPLVQGFEMIFTRHGLVKAPLLKNLAHFKGVWVMGYTEGFPRAIRLNLHGSEVASREQALLMVLSGRADYYLDNKSQMARTLGGAAQRLRGYDWCELYASKIYMVFTKNERGRAIRDFYDRAIGVLMSSGALKNIYEKWTIALPDVAWDSSPSTMTLSPCQAK
ncbi:MAG: transporter substrate-binding domain-containing protein [Chitinophagaceae bacterium]|nr:transporter substrate-binding domain-containing protein [Oligoflexus sp.]